MTKVRTIMLRLFPVLIGACLIALALGMSQAPWQELSSAKSDAHTATPVIQGATTGGSFTNPP